MTAAGCAGLQTACVGRHGAGGANQVRAPLRMSSAVRPPPLEGSTPVGRQSNAVASARSASEVRHRGVDVPAIAREPPDDPAVDAALADACLPDELAAASGVEPVDDAGLLTDEQPLDAVGQTLEHGRCADVVIHPGTTAAAAAIARQIELVPGVSCFDHATAPSAILSATTASLIAV